MVQDTARDEKSHEVPEEKNFLQDDALTQAELDYLLKVKTAIIEPDPQPEPKVVAPQLSAQTKSTRPDHSFPVDDTPWVEAEA